MEVANLYDNGPISPVAQIDEHLTILTENNIWQTFQVLFIEGIPRSRPMMIDLVALNAAANIPAYTALAVQFVQAIQPAGNDKARELLHLRWEPLDDVEGMLYEQAPARYSPRGAQATVTMYTALRDPYLATVTFFVIGVNRDARIGAYNPNPVALPRARFVFWGERYIVAPVPADWKGISRRIPAQQMAF